MSNVTPLTINDGLVTPVARLFAVSETDNGYQKWLFVPSGLTLADGITIALKHTRASNTGESAMVKNRLIIRKPVKDAAALAYLPKGITIDTTFEYPNGSSEADRADILAFHLNAFGVTIVSEQLKGIQAIY